MFAGPTRRPDPRCVFAGRSRAAADLCARLVTIGAGRSASGSGVPCDPLGARGGCRAGRGRRARSRIAGRYECRNRAAQSLMPISKLGGIKADIAMTAVLSIALEGEPRCALLLAHVIDRAGHDPRRAVQLCGSWLEFHFGRSGCGSGFAPEQKTLRKFDATPIVTTADLQFAHTVARCPPSWGPGLVPSCAARANLSRLPPGFPTPSCRLRGLPV